MGEENKTSIQEHFSPNSRNWEGLIVHLGFAKKDQYFQSGAFCSVTFSGKGSNASADNCVVSLCVKQMSPCAILCCPAELDIMR